MWVTIVSYTSPLGLDCSAPPVPTFHGFTRDKPYQVWDWVMEGSELKAVLVNDKGEIWAINNRHLRFHGDLRFQKAI